MSERACPRLIEVALPIREISAKSVRDESLHHGYIPTLYIWWASRLRRGIIHNTGRRILRRLMGLREQGPGAHGERSWCGQARKPGEEVGRIGAVPDDGCRPAGGYRPLPQSLGER